MEDQEGVSDMASSNYLTISDLVGDVEVRYMKLRLNDDSDSIYSNDTQSDLLSKIIKRLEEGETSHIHIETRSESAVIRVRSKGLLSDGVDTDKDAVLGVIWRVKSLAGLEEVSALPQNGKFNLKVDGELSQYEVSVLPTTDGEKVVISCRRDKSLPDKVNSGLWGEAASVAADNLATLRGVILCSGQVGKFRQALHQNLLSESWHKTIEVVSIESNPSYKLDGINQLLTTSMTGLGVAQALEAVIRQDVDIVGVEEIKDSQIAKLIFDAASIKKMMVSSIYSADHRAAISRLLDLGVEPYLIASNLVAVIHQRVFKKLCSKCRQPYRLESKEAQQTIGIYGIKPDKQGRDVLDRLIDDAKVAGFAVPDEAPLGDMQRLVFWKAGEGCAECRGRGYEGFVAVCEAFEVDSGLKKLILDENIKAIRKYSPEDYRGSRQSLALALLGQIGVDEL